EQGGADQQYQEGGGTAVQLSRHRNALAATYRSAVPLPTPVSRAWDQSGAPTELLPCLGGSAMDRTARVTITLPADVLQAVEEARRARNETRSQFIERAVGALLGRPPQRSAEELEEAYIRGYREHPETEEEIALSRTISH